MARVDLIGAARPLPPGERAWAFAVGAPYHVAQGFAVDGIDEPEADDPQLEMLASAWGTNDRDDLISRMNDLGDEGHRHDHVLKLRYYSMLWRPAIAAMREEMRADMREGGEDAEEAAANLWRLDTVQADLPGIRSSTLLAFDAARGIMLARAGLMLGWLREDEAWPYMIDVARDVRRTYRSWEEYGADLLLSRQVWAGQAKPDVFDDAVALLLRSPASPWRKLDWATPPLDVPRPVWADEKLVWTLERR